MSERAEQIGAPRPGVVVIGRNEGDRLRRCLESLAGRAGTIVYVDSGSTDGSVALARAAGAEVVELPSSQPFTAARARNAGFERLMAVDPLGQLVQFVDGDCRVAEGWMERAAGRLRASPKLGVVCGRRREVAPGASIYNRLCDLEWDTPVGEARSCGGDAMMRVEAFRQVGGFDPTVIAGEEPELCVRLRAAGWTIERMDAEMTLHDASMTRFGQWWRRSVRAGHAYAEGSWRHGAPPERHCVRDVRSIVFWAGVLPLIALVALIPSRGASLVVLLAIDGLQGWRIARGQRRRGRQPGEARLYALFTVLGKFAQLRGVIQFHLNRWTGKKATIIEYKGPAAAAPAEQTSGTAA